jgi:hypothetical protein
LGAAVLRRRTYSGAVLIVLLPTGSERPPLDRGHLMADEQRLTLA